MAIDKAQAKTIQQDVNAALEAVFAKHGLKMVKGRCSYDVGMIRVSAEAHAQGADDPQITDWHRYAQSYGLDASMIGKSIMVGRVAYRVKGLALSRSRFPVAVERLQDSKPMLLTIEAVRGAQASAK